ncbi:hypothetical protein D3C81_1773860 [compost metagenome]
MLYREDQVADHLQHPLFNLVELCLPSGVIGNHLNRDNRICDDIHLLYRVCFSPIFNYIITAPVNWDKMLLAVSY